MRFASMSTSGMNWALLYYLKNELHDAKYDFLEKKVPTDILEGVIEHICLSDICIGEVLTVLYN